MDVNTLNELMAALGFIIPSAVLWQVWNIRSSFNKTQAQVEQMQSDIAKLKRLIEDEMLKRQVLNNGN